MILLYKVYYNLYIFIKYINICHQYKLILRNYFRIRAPRSVKICRAPHFFFFLFRIESRRGVAPIESRGRRSHEARMRSVHACVRACLRACMRARARVRGSTGYGVQEGYLSGNRAWRYGPNGPRMTTRGACARLDWPNAPLRLSRSTFRARRNEIRENKDSKSAIYTRLSAHCEFMLIKPVGFTTRWLFSRVATTRRYRRLRYILLLPFCPNVEKTTWRIPAGALLRFTPWDRWSRASIARLFRK